MRREKLTLSTLSAMAHHPASPTPRGNLVTRLLHVAEIEFVGSDVRY